MDDEDKNRVVLSKGINYKELMASGTEFQIDVNFQGKKNKRDPLLMDEKDAMNDVYDERKDSFSRRHCRVSYSQLKVLLQTLSENRSLATGYNKSCQGRDEAKRLWEATANTLNSLGDGAVKDWKGWNKYWNDYKSKLKTRVAAIRVANERTGGESADEVGLSEVEKKFLQVLGEGFGSGLPRGRVESFEENTTEEHNERLPVKHEQFIHTIKIEPYSESIITRAAKTPSNNNTGPQRRRSRTRPAQTLLRPRRSQHPSLLEAARRDLVASSRSSRARLAIEERKAKALETLVTEIKEMKSDIRELKDAILSSDDSDDALQGIEQAAAKHMLASPEYISFKQLAADMTDCLPTGEVKMLIIEEGDGPLVPYDAQITMHYAAYWEKESIPFDSSLTMNYGKPVTYQLGIGRLLPGLEIGISSVHGPKARLYLMVDGDAAWGKLGALPRIRAEPALFIVSLLDVSDVSAEERFNDLPREEQKKFETTLKTVKACNEHAKALFQKHKYEKAVKNYHKSLSVLQICCPANDAENEEIKRMLVNVYMSLAVTYYKLKVPYKVILMCDDLARITDVDKHCKALFYYGRAFQMQGQYDDAIKFYKKALKCEPKNPEIGRAMADLDSIIKKSSKVEKEMWRSVFKGAVNTSDAKADVKRDVKSDFNIDEEFRCNLKATCEDLAQRSEYVKFDLPTGLTKDESEYIKALVKDFDKLAVVENGEGREKKMSIIKKMY